MSFPSANAGQNLGQPPQQQQQLPTLRFRPPVNKTRGSRRGAALISERYLDTVNARIPYPPVLAPPNNAPAAAPGPMGISPAAPHPANMRIIFGGAPNWGEFSSSSSASEKNKKAKAEPSSASEITVDVSPYRSPKENFNGDELSEHYWAMYQSAKFCDAKLQVGERIFPVHRAILAARSPVFSAMFDSVFAEESGNVEITDLAADVVEKMLAWIYCGRYDDMEELAGELLAAADKYQLDSLKNQCEDYLMNHLNVDIVCQTFILADLYQTPRLRAKCIDFIISNGAQVSTTSGMTKLAAEHPQLLIELFKTLGSKMI